MRWWDINSKWWKWTVETEWSSNWKWWLDRGDFWCGAKTTTIFDSKIGTFGSNDLNSCVICTGVYNQNKVVLHLLLPCDCIFNENCIIHWSKDYNTGPFVQRNYPWKMKHRKKNGGGWIQILRPPQAMTINRITNEKGYSGERFFISIPIQIVFVSKI